MNIENIRVFNFENALRGMRNPKESWHLSDSYYGISFNDPEEIESITHGQEWKTIYIDGDICEYASIGPKDMKLAQGLIKAGSEHRKFMRQIFVSMDIAAPIYWWKEMDTYKLATTANSTSTMHKLTSKPITLDCFEIGDYNNSLPLIDPVNLGIRIDCLIGDLEQLRQLYLMNIERSKQEDISESERKNYQNLARSYWKELVRWLPCGWIQTRTWTGNYENLLSIVHQRANHKLIEWHYFVDKIKTLPYAQELIFCNEN